MIPSKVFSLGKSLSEKDFRLFTPAPTFRQRARPLMPRALLGADERGIHRRGREQDSACLGDLGL